MRLFIGFIFVYSKLKIYKKKIYTLMLAWHCLNGKARGVLGRLTVRELKLLIWKMRMADDIQAFP